MAVNPYRNEVETTLAEKKIKLRATFDCIAKLEDYFDAPLFNIVMNKLNQADMRIGQIVEVYALGSEAAEQPVSREELQELVMHSGTVEAIGSLVPFLTQAFAGGKPESKKK